MNQFNFANKLHILRIERGWSQKELANKTGLSQSTIQKYETGEYKLTKIDTVYKFINAFEISFDYFLHDFLDVFKKEEASNFIKKIDFELSQMDEKKLKLVNDIVDAIIKREKLKS